jgi:CMP-N-acetylneuraminic acid synthetase
MKKRNIIGLIPARGGSVGVPLKNIRNLGGKPLIAYTIEAAIKSNVLDRIIVSTDHEEIAKVSLHYGAEVPFKRPPDISEDVETELVLKHAVEYLEENEGIDIDAIVLLQPTSPFRSHETIRKCVERYINTTQADSVVTVNNVEGYRPEWMLSIDEENNIFPYATPFLHNKKPVIKLIARQDFPELYKQNGVVYVTNKDLLMEDNLVIGPNAFAEVIPEMETFDIDTETDLLIAEAIYKENFDND